ncbi:hypothetical protein PF005_g17013 [Phytophthora fragariae]|nr:hypothetical protein PF003_g21210 [Phytophthora fragariae]KAE8931693.1 hypothetical protein PF009_g18250 [Phytophthora fragariae]KAE9127105.1 hypothetical protein PF006_g16575 [Phytophthora fragariae]KAE9196098.1 hypothetical protein PF005_g17013 [Phytophthora fragariae]KAE9212195.1 hypothetical protein PF002_g18315 [Phytophthora fragariae]
MTAVQPAQFEKRNWTDESTIALVRAWKKVDSGERRKDEKTTMAVEDKLQALREMFRFISDVNANRISGSTGKPEWFELCKKEKKELRQRHRMKSPNMSQDVFEELNTFLGQQPDTEPLEATFNAQPRFQDDVQRSKTPDALFGTPTTETSSTDQGKDPHNTGRKNNKRKRNSKYEDMKEILQERSEALFARTEKLQREEMEERRKEHAERMELMRALVMALSKSAGEM